MHVNLVHVSVLRRLFRGKVLGLLADAHAVGRLQFFSKLAPLADKKTFRPVPGAAAPDRLGGLLQRRLIAADDGGVSFRWKDYRVEGPDRWETMTLGAHEFIRRFPIHVLPKGFHIRHYGLFANGNRAESSAKARELLAVAPPTPKPEPAKAAADEPRVLAVSTITHIDVASATSFDGPC